MIKVIRSYNRKISHENYGGGRFETSDHFVSFEEEVENEEAAKLAAQRLYALAKEEVRASVIEETGRIKKAKEESEKLKAEQPPF